MRFSLCLFGREVLALEFSGLADEEYVANTDAVIESGPGDDGTRYAPGFNEDDCFEPEDGSFRLGFAGGAPHGTH